MEPPSLFAAFVALVVLASAVSPCPAVLVPDAPAGIVHHPHEARTSAHDAHTSHHARPVPGALDTAEAELAAPCPCGCGEHSGGIHVRLSSSPFLPPHVPGLDALDARTCASGAWAGAPDAPATRVFHVPISV
jgi:hypothetical protein